MHHCRNSSARASGSEGIPDAQITNALIRLTSSIQTPITAASDTAGCCTRQPSTSAGETHRPPTLIMSSVRPW